MMPPTVPWAPWMVGEMPSPVVKLLLAIGNVARENRDFDLETHALALAETMKMPAVHARFYVDVAAKLGLVVDLDVH
jgi:hypothetical protein